MQIYCTPSSAFRTFTCNLLRRAGFVPSLVCALLAILLSGCASPMGADKVSTRQAYEQVQANALRSGKPSADTVSLLHRFNLDRLAAKQPDEAVRQLHQKALASGERDLLYALAEMSYAAAHDISRSVKPWDSRDARDYYLGSAVYAWLFLFGEGKEALPSPFDRRFREACDFYNYGLGLALTGRRSTNAVVRFENGRRRLPVGEIELRVNPGKVASRLEQVEEILLADQFLVRGLSVRNREAGVGAPLIAVLKSDPVLGVSRAGSGTVLLRVTGSLADLAAGRSEGTLELYSPFDKNPTVTIGQAQVPLEFDLTAYRAYTLNQSTIWKLGNLGFLAPAERIPSRLILTQPYDPNLIPVVYVHGTFSSPVTWAEMANTLAADPVLHRRYQIWLFMYGSGNPLVQSIADLRTALTDQVQRLDPEGTNVMLRNMVVIGHSQGGLLTHATAIDSGDRLWRMVSTNRLEDLPVNETQRTNIQRMLFLKPLPFVKRVVFICAPHRGSYMAGGFVRRLAQRFVSLPGNLVARGQNALELMKGSESAKFLGGKLPTSLDGMSPKNPTLLAMADIPVSPPIKAHSIVAIDGEEQPPEGGDGIVKYTSAHVDYGESEFIVRSYHSCLNKPETIEELRRILHEHLASLPAQGQ
jgi:pimeloyl-ACP methyl ester carboxylesterase